MERVLALSIGMILFLILCGMGILLKWGIQVWLEKRCQGRFWPEVISDTVAICFMIYFSIITTPYMGQGKLPLAIFD